jgi:hypothetical protein
MVPCARFRHQRLAQADRHLGRLQIRANRLKAIEPDKGEAMLGFFKVVAAAVVLITTAHSVRGQAPFPSTSKTAVSANGLVADFYQPAQGRGPLPALIVIGGSRGGLDDRTAWQAAAFAEHGYAVLHLAYLVGPGLPPSAHLPTAIHLIPLEYFKTAIDWLRTQPAIDSSRIGIVGTSIGGMAALLVAARYSDLSVVVAAVPSSVVWSTFGSSRISMFSHAGQPVPFLPYGVGRGLGRYDLFDDGLNAVGQHPDAVIPVEKINGPVMAICGKLDAVWPSCRMSAQIGARLEANDFKHAFQILA